MSLRPANEGWYSPCFVIAEPKREHDYEYF